MNHIASFAPSREISALGAFNPVPDGPHWQASHSSPLRMASIEQARFSSAV
jgi:hypothetical protein